MTVKMSLAKGAKKYLKIKPVLSKSDASEAAIKALRNLLVEGMKSLLRRSKTDFSVVDAELLYHPFWVIEAQSYFHYVRKDQYSFAVPAEVQSLKIGGVGFDTEGGACTVTADSTCFEHYVEVVVQDALNKKGKDFTKYQDHAFTAVKSLKSVKDGKIADVSVRASYVLNSIYTKIIQPINADKVKESRVDVSRLELWLVPTYVFTICVDGKNSVVSVDAVTGEVRKDSSIINELTKKYWSGDTVFDISSEVAATIVPGAGVGMILARKAIEARGKAKQDKRRSKFKSEFSKRKK